MRGIADNKAFPVLLMDQYSRGKLLVLTIPDNFLRICTKRPAPALNAIRSYIVGDFPVRIEAPAQVSLFAYDNGAFIVESFRDQPADITILESQGSTLTNLASGAHPTPLPSVKPAQPTVGPHLSADRVKLEAHS